MRRLLVLMFFWCVFALAAARQCKSHGVCACASVFVCVCVCVCCTGDMSCRCRYTCLVCMGSDPVSCNQTRKRFVNVVACFEGKLTNSPRFKNIFTHFHQKWNKITHIFITSTNSPTTHNDCTHIGRDSRYVTATHCDTLQHSAVLTQVRSLPQRQHSCCYEQGVQLEKFLLSSVLSCHVPRLTGQKSSGCRPSVEYTAIFWA